MTTAGTAPKQLTARGTRTRNQLITAARTIFERDGFAAARITDIADLAGVAHGTFYTYFDAKEDIFRELILVVREEMLTGEVEGVESPPEEQGKAPWCAVARANRRYLAAYRANAQLMVIWEQAATINESFKEMLADSRHRFAERAEKSIIDLQKSGHADRTLDPYYTAVALGAMVSRFSYIWFAGNEDFEFETAVDQLTRIWCNALGLPHRK